MAPRNPRRKSCAGAEINRRNYTPPSLVDTEYPVSSCIDPRLHLARPQLVPHTQDPRQNRPVRVGLKHSKHKSLTHWVQVLSVCLS